MFTYLTPLFFEFITNAVLVNSGITISPIQSCIQYINEEFLKDVSLVIRKRSRNSPHYMQLQFEFLQPLGDNFTVEMSMMENLSSGRWQPMPLHMTYTLCDFLYNEPVLGKMYAKQLPSNWSCPFPKGVFKLNDLIIDLSTFKYRLPFTFSAVKVKTRADVNGFLNVGKNTQIFRFYVILLIEEKRRRAKTKSNSTLTSNYLN